jgi:hypothetical protein
MKLPSGKCVCNVCKKERPLYELYPFAYSAQSGGLVYASKEFGTDSIHVCTNCARVIRESTKAAGE